MPPATAHPHVFITAKVTPIFDAEGRFAAVHEHWSFDQDVTGPALNRPVRDGRLEAADVAAAMSGGGPLAWIRRHAYLTRLTIAGRQVLAGEARDIGVWVRPPGVVVEFTLPLAEATTVAAGAGVDVFDPEYFYAVYLDGSTIQSPTAPPACAVTRRRDANIDPVAAMLLRQLQLPADPRVLGDPAAGHEVRVAIDCR